MFANNSTKSRSGFIHLYNPKIEGIGLYDVHYINAQRKDKKKINPLKEKAKGRYAAWSLC